ncbi:MAG: Crp/Fnr family transcriptional regulator [Candidatus Saccharimonadales bacterium]
MNDMPLVELFRNATLYHFRKGEIILRGNEQPKGVYMILDGFVKVYSITKQGNEHIRAFYKVGEIFPTLYVFHSTIQNAFYESFTKTTLQMISDEEFLLRLNSNPKIMRAVMDQLVEKVSVYSGRIENLEYSNSYDRVAYSLLSLAHRFGQYSEDGWVIAVPQRHQHIADSLSLSRETVSRVLERMQRKGLIVNKHGFIVILDLEGLTNIIGKDEVLTSWPLFQAYLAK